MKTFRFFVGTHASAGQDSLCLCEADFKASTFAGLHTMREISDPTYLALSPDKILYTFGKTAAGVSVYAIRDQVVLNSLPCASGGPCHISVDGHGEFLLVAGYGSGTVSLYDLNPDGTVRSLSDFRQYSGVGYDSADRQKGPHAHFAVFHKDRDEVLVCDLGLDTVYVYELNRKSGKLRETTRSIRLPDGSGPRHLAFSDKHPGMLFVLTEMANTIFTYRYDPKSDKYVLVQQISAVSDAASDEALMQPSTADNGSIGCAIRFTGDGKYLFVSSRRGYQSISAFRCDPDGKFCFADRSLCGGITPRDFNVFESDDPADQVAHLLVANQDSDLITTLRFDRKTEKLSLMDMKMQAVKPTCILPV
ncbi:MAG: lactonase family protein [Lachnospiraceae bacterium]|nr:lactonase family protein [Lachnospiraceae bacterium]